MATKIEYKIGDEIRIKCGRAVEVVKITYITKWYITCGKEYEFHAHTHRCVNNKWEIIGLNKPLPKPREPKEKGLPRGKSWKEQGLKGRTTKNKPKQ